MLLRGGLWLLTGTLAVVGAWAAALPALFYERFPWVALNPPFSEHLMRDFGSTTLALALVTAVAAVTVQRLLVRTALCAFLLFAVPHLIFHATHLEHFDTTSAVTALAGLIVSVGLPAALLALTLPGDHERRARVRGSQEPDTR